MSRANFPVTPTTDWTNTFTWLVRRTVCVHPCTFLTNKANRCTQITFIHQTADVPDLVALDVSLSGADNIAVTVGTESSKLDGSELDAANVMRCLSVSLSLSFLACHSLALTHPHTCASNVGASERGATHRVHMQRHVFWLHQVHLQGQNQRGCGPRCQRCHTKDCTGGKGCLLLVFYVSFHASFGGTCVLTPHRLTAGYGHDWRRDCDHDW